MNKKTNNWKKVTVRNAPFGTMFTVFEAKKGDRFEQDLNKHKVLSSGEIDGGTLSCCYYDVDFIIRVRKGGILPIEFHSVMLDRREEAVIEAKEDK